MKRNLQKMIALLAVLFMPFLLFSQEYGHVLKESFENGLPQEWKQEKVSGDISWIVETNGTRPTGAYDGEKRLVFRNNSNVTTKSKTRLVLPSLDISKMYQPILVFAHAQDKWTNDVDVLKVLYRTSPDADWTELKVFDKYISRWQVDTVRLIGANKTYEIALEATDNLGRGVVIDNIEVRSTPNCLLPFDLVTTNVANESVTLNWLGAYDAESFSLKVSTVALTSEQLNDEAFKADVLDVTVSDVWTYDLQGLDQGTTYYYYVKSNCYNEVSDWASTTFKTANTIQLPYVEYFNHEATPGFVTYPKGWYLYGTSTKPYVNSGNTNDMRYTSNDASYVLCFNGSKTSAGSTNIPGGQYAYAAMPEINIPSLSVLEVSFWTIRYYPGNSERFSIIVGVMTDPDVKGSFVPVDTIDVTDYYEHIECNVSLENYKGNGKYIAFMSDFAESNIFVIDNIVVDYRPEVSKVSYKLGIPAANSFKFDFDREYDSYEVIVAKEQIDVDELETATDVQRFTVANGGTIEGVAPASALYVSARGVKGSVKGEWSYPRYVRTPGKATEYPYLIDFELNTNDSATFYCAQKGIKINTAGKLVPEIIYHTDYTLNAACGNTYWTSTSTKVPARTPYELQLTANVDNDSWMIAVMSEMVDPKNTLLGFYATNHSESYGSTFYVGVMSDANDPSTFVVIDTITAGMGYEYYSYELSKYDVKGKFVAFKIDKGQYEEDYSSCYVWIDDVKYETIPECAFPTNPVVTSDPNDPSRVTIKWDANGVTQWNVRMAEVEYNRDSLYVDSLNYSYVFNGTTNTNSVEITGLKFPAKTYYYWLQPICGDKAGRWTVTYKYKSECYGIQPLPYFEDFENEAYSTSSTDREFTVPCLYTQRIVYSYYSSTSYYPYLSSVYASEPDGGTSLYLSKSSSWVPTGLNTYVALPKMAAPVKDLELSFKMRVSDTKYTISVGVMEDPLDSANTEIVSVIKPKFVNEFVEYVVTFENYTGKGEYIAITTNDCYSNPAYYIDEIKVDYKSACPRTGELALNDITNTSATFSWPNTSAASWRIMITDKRLTPEELVNPVVGGSIISIDTVATNPATINGLADNTAYFAYVQTVCESLGAWSNPLPFRTSCELKDAGALGVENFDTYGTGNGKYPPCFVVGNIMSPSSVAYIPQCNTGYKHSGSASLKFSTTTSYNGAYAISSRIDVSDISMLRVKFWGSTGTEANAKSDYAHLLVVGVVTDPSDLGTFMPVDTLNFGYEGIPYEVNLSTYKYDSNGEKGKYVMFLSQFDKKNIVYIDDLEFDTIPACLTRVEAGNITHNSVDVKFIGGSAPYQLKYAETLCSVEDLNKDLLPEINVTTGNTTTITGLEPNTSYYIYGRANCGDQQSDWSVVEVVRTSCLELWTLPYSNGFEDQKSTSGVPMCWNYYYDGASTSYPGLNASNYASSKPGLYLYASSAVKQSYLVTQAIDIDNLAKCQVSFQMKPNVANKNHSVVVGVVSNPDSIVETFVPVDTIILKQSTLVFEQQLVLLDSYVGTGKYIAFQTNYELNEKASGGAYIDDITIERIPTCAKPMDCYLAGITESSITIGYAHETATQFEVKYGAVDFDPALAGTSVVVTGKEAKITSLNPETEYDIYVRALCSDADVSPWEHVGVFTTPSIPVSLYPYRNDFSDLNENARWLFAQNDQPNQWYIGADAANMVTDGVNNGGKALYISKDGGLSAQYRADKDEQGVAATSYSWAYRTIALEAGVYTISYDWTCFGESTADYVRVGLLPVTSTFAAGANSVRALDGTSVSFTYTVATQPKGWFELSETVMSGTTTYYKNNLVDTTKTLAEQWETINKVIIVNPEQAGIYNLVVYWKNDASKGAYAHVRSAVIDNIVINKETCIQPRDLRHTAYTESSADLTWDLISGNPAQFEVLVTTEETIEPNSLTTEQIVSRQIVNTREAKITGLAENTSYYYYVRSVCGANDTSLWAGPAMVKTACSPQQIDTVYSFDSEEGYYLPTYTDGKTQTTYKVPNCFVNSHETLEFTSTNASYFPYLYKNTTSAQYSRSGDYCLRFYRTKQDQAGGAIALPMIEGNMDELQVTFWMRCVHNTKSTKKLTVTGIGSTYERTIVVGTMTDPYDPSTFEALGEFVYPYKNGELTTNNLIDQDPNGNNYWVECSMPLAGAKGKYIAFKNAADEESTTYNLIYVDDIKVTSLSCLAPSAPTYSNITSKSASVDAVVSEAERYVIQYADNEEFNNAQFDTVATLPATITGLANGKEYFVKVQSLCSAEETSKWGYASSFTTLTTLSYSQAFEQASYRPSDWSLASAPKLDDYLAGTTTTFSGMLPTASGGWATKAALFDEGMFSTRHLRVQITSTNKYWLFSPKFEMPESGKTHLVFELALTNQNDYQAIDEEDLTYTDDRFVVLVSEDAGETWTRDNMTIWGHDYTAEYKLFDIPNTGKQYEIDLTKYAGKNIQIAFYAESQVSSTATMDLHIDNVHLNTYKDELLNVSLCETEDLDYDPFVVVSEDLEVGNNSFTYMTQSSKAADVNYKLDVLVTPMVETHLEATICEGDVYSKNNFSGLMEPGTYKQKLVSSNGCDSVVVLDLTMTAAERTMIFDTICYGNSVVWNGVEYDKTGTYVETLVSKVTGCDSIVTFVLNVKDAIRTTKYANICYNDTLEFGTLMISESGEYQETFVTSEGCDSIVTLHATVLPDLRQTINATIFEGEQYNDNGFVGLTIGGTYTLPLTSQDGCDSTVTLVLKVIDPTEVALDNLKATDLTLVPNPVKVNNTLYINAEFTSEEAEGLVVEVFNAIGQLVYSENPTLYPIAIEGLAQRGVYMVRITTGSGQIYQGKVIVE